MQRVSNVHDVRVLRPYTAVRVQLACVLFAPNITKDGRIIASGRNALSWTTLGAREIIREKL